MKLMIINGPNLNMLGIREPGIYGDQSYDHLVEMIRSYCNEKHIEVSFFQSNHEGDLVDCIQKAYFASFDGIVINPGAYTHTSIALLDALKAVSIPAAEVHISKVNEREAFRQISYIREVCIASVIGLGFDGYLKAVDLLCEAADGKMP